MAAGRLPRAAAAAAAALVLLLASGASAWLPPQVVAPYSPSFGCYQDVQIFSSLKYGDFDFCRLKLRYRPGRPECLRIMVSTCNLVVPGKRSPGPPGGLEGYAERIVCPPGPPPPTCPSGYFGSG
jgi:hypothetical protein